VTVRVVAITDRQRADVIASVPTLLAAAPPGTVAVQVREKDLDGGALLALVEQVVAVARPFAAPVWVNDRVDVALVAGADGVHLPERGLAIADARAVIASTGRRLVVGASRHSADAANAAAHDGAELIQLGPIWNVEGKAPPLGVDALSVRARLPAAVTLVAVGGIDSAERAYEVARAGADAVAVIRAAWSPDAASHLAALIAAVERGVAARLAHGR
jgi:thiamine-phosphate pyrophosphorylase